MTGNRFKTVRIIEIAELLDVSHQRASKIATSSAFRRRSAARVRGRL